MKWQLGLTVSINYYKQYFKSIFYFKIKLELKIFNY